MDTKTGDSMSRAEYLENLGNYSKPRKYRNIPTFVEDQRFDSRKEARRFQELTLLAKAGEIEQLECQVSYPFNYKRKAFLTYVADFTYIDRRTNEFVVEDVKSKITAANPVYRIKKKAMLLWYGIEIFET